jgi:hypothetical protein
MRLPLVLSQVVFLFSTAAIADTTATISSAFDVTTQGPMSCDKSVFSSSFVDVTTAADNLASFGALNFEVTNPGSGIVRADTPAGEEATRGGNTEDGTGLGWDRSCVCFTQVTPNTVRSSRKSGEAASSIFFRAR